jgi:L-amino acid N-acyltransferase YncA
VPGDKSDILGFCTSTFDWGDYVPEVVDDWLSGTAGKLLVAVENGKVVALTHLAVFGPAEGWLEGMRVAPEFRKMGLGSLLTTAAVDVAREMGLRVLRMAINQTNMASLSLAKKMRFHQVLLISDVSAEPLPAGEVIGVRLAVDADLAAVVRMLRWSSYGGLSFFEWEARVVDENFIAQAIQTSQLWVHEVGGEVCACCFIEYERSHGVAVGNLAGSARGVRALLEFARRRSSLLKGETVSVTCVTGGPEEAVALAVGFSNHYDAGDESGKELIFQKHI